MYKRYKSFLSGVTCLGFVACGQGSRPVAGNYRLRQLISAPGVVPADTSYDLWDTARPENETSNSGKVLRLGWNAHTIIVLRSPAPTPYGVPAGWSVIDVDRGKQALLAPSDAAGRAALQHIVVYRSDSAWARL